MIFKFTMDKNQIIFNDWFLYRYPLIFFFPLNFIFFIFKLVTFFFFSKNR